MKFGAGLWMFGQFVDRYAADAYGPEVSTLEAIERAGAVGRLEALDVNYPFSHPDITVEEVDRRAAQAGLRATTITPHLYMREFVRGALTNPDPAVRKRALEISEEAVDVAQRLGAPTVKLWPGQDGFDYPFQADYRELEARGRRRAHRRRDGRARPRRDRVQDQGAAHAPELVDGGTHPARHRTDRPRRRRHRHGPRPLAVRQGGARRAVARARAWPPLHDRGQRQLARVGRRPRGRLDPPDRDARVLPRGPQDRLGRADLPRPVPLPRGPRRGGADEHQHDPRDRRGTRPHRPRRAQGRPVAPGRPRRPARPDRAAARPITAEATR